MKAAIILSALCVAIYASPLPAVDETQAAPQNKETVSDNIV